MPQPALPAWLAALPKRPARPARPTVTFNVPASINDDDWYEYDPATLRVLSALPPRSYDSWSVPRRGRRGGVIVRGLVAKHLGLQQTVVREVRA